LKEREYTEHDFGERYQEVKTMSSTMTISGDVIGEIESFIYVG
jgi:hypothetical protein